MREAGRRGGQYMITVADGDTGLVDKGKWRGRWWTARKDRKDREGGGDRGDV